MITARRPTDQRRMLALLACELEDARAQIEALGAALCTDIDLMGRHLDELQALDHAGQRCAAIANILRSTDILAAITTAPLETITDRVEAQL